jgi:hypothetical protein
VEVNMKKPKQKPAPQIDYKVRSGATIRDMDTGISFDLICYGMSHSELCAVDCGPGPGPAPADYVDMTGGQRLRRALERRGIDTDRWRANIFETWAIK